MNDSMPPITLEEMKSILRNPNFKTYLVIGSQSDDAWSLAEAAQNFLAGVRSYLVKDAAEAEVRSNFNVAGDCVGIIFGRSDSVNRMLTKREAEDFLTVTQAITNA